MKKINNSNFEILEEVIKNIDFNYNPKSAEIKTSLQAYWEEAIGENISKLAKVYNFSSDNKLTVTCADSFVSNELYFQKDKLISIMNKKIQKMGIEIKDITFDYKKWKEKNE